MAGNMNTTVALVKHNAEEHPDVPFVYFYDEVVTYKDLDTRTDTFAAYLQSIGIDKGSIVSLMMGNTPCYYYTLLGANKAGAAGGPINGWWQAPEVEFLVGNSRPKVLVVDPEYASIVSTIKDKMPSVQKVIVNSTTPMDLDFPHDYLPEIINGPSRKPDMSSTPSKDDIAILLYTSGTTGKPKGVMDSHRNILASCESKKGVVPLQVGERVLCVLPLFHGAGLIDISINCLYAAATVVLRRKFSASEFWESVEKYKVNGFYIVPTMWNILLKAPEADTVDTSSLRVAISGASPIAPEQLDECERRFHIPILEAYGQTECAGGITVNSIEKRKYGSVGMAMPGIEVRIQDENGQVLPAGEVGEIVMKGDTVMKGYFNNPEATAETIKDGWLHTGDVGYVDEDGFYFLVDRIKDLIIRGGVNVYPKEIESVIVAHPAVDSVAVIPEPHDKYGQVSKACVILKRGEICSKEEILEFCRERMASYKVPEDVVFRVGFPKNAVGKVVKKDLIKELEEELVAEPVPVAHFFEGMPDRFIPEKAEGVDATVSYHITGKGGGEWTVTIKDGKIRLTEEVLKSPRVLIVTKDSAYHDIATGKLDGITAVMTGKMTVEGDAAFMAEFRNMFR